MVSESQFRNRCNLVSHFCSWQLFRIFTKMNGPNMQTLIVQPENKEQLLAVESVLKLLKINFVVEEDEALPTYVADGTRSEEHTSELQSLMRISYAFFCLKKNINI